METDCLSIDVVQQVLWQITQDLDSRLALSATFLEALTPVFGRILEGAFPSYSHSNINVVRANRRAIGRPSASIKGLVPHQYL